MKQIRIVPVLFLLLLASCKSESPTSSGTGAIVLLNSSFESDGMPSDSIWSIPPPPLSGFSTDVPPNGGKYSIFIEAGNPGQNALASLALPQGMHVFRLSIWAKTTAVTGYADLLFVPAYSSNDLRKRIEIPDTTWHQYSLDDTLTAQSGDSIRVVLSAGIGEVIFSLAYFDLCKLEQLQ